MDKSKLYVCATPIGHLDDCSFRLIDTLKTVDCIAAEDTRRTKKLLSRFDISKPLISLEKFNESERVNTIISRLQKGESVALVSDAGTPTISDPGALLVKFVCESGFDAVPIPGPSAVVTLLSVSGLPTDNFIFTGFLPRKFNELKDMYTLYRSLNVPIVFYESPKRLLKHLNWLLDIDPDAYIGLGKEMTKQYERFFNGDINVVISNLENCSSIKGEWCGVVIPSAEENSHQKQLGLDIDFCKQLGLTDTQIKSVLLTFRDYQNNEVKKQLWS